VVVVDGGGDSGVGGVGVGFSDRCGGMWRGDGECVHMCEWVSG
jgi:hypothetical protein